MIKVLTYIEKKGYLWCTSQTLEHSQRRTSKDDETVTMGRKDKRSQRTKLPKLQKEHAEVMKNEVAELRGKLQKTSQAAKKKLQQETPAGIGSG